MTQTDESIRTLGGVVVMSLLLLAVAGLGGVAAADESVFAGSLTDADDWDSASSLSGQETEYGASQSGDSLELTYDTDEFSGVWAYRTTADGAGTVELDWSWEGHHSWYRSDGIAAIYVDGERTDTLATVDGDFSRSGTTTLDVENGDTISVKISGQHYDRARNLQGTLVLSPRQSDDESATPSEGELTFNDQTLSEDGTVTVEDVSTSQASTVVVTYTDGDAEVVAGVTPADNLDGKDIQVAIQDTGGFPGEHTAWVFDDDDLPANLGIGADATPVASAALDSESADVSAQSSGELTFTDQELSEDGTVTVEDVSTGQASTVVVTYTDDEEEVVAGVAPADRLSHEDVSVEIQDTGGFPGEHTAWVFDDDDLPADLGIGADATPVASAALDSETADVSARSSGELTFTDQELSEDGTVTVEDVSTSQASTVVVTYTDGSEEVVAGGTNADNLDGRDVRVAIENTGGFPGEHTAWAFDDDDLPADLGIGADATPVASAALDSETATVTRPASGDLTFSDQRLGADGTVTVEDVSTGQASTVVVTYTDGDQEVVAGLASADRVSHEDVQVAIEDTGGFPGEHTAWVFDDDDLPANLGIGADATPVADRALDSESAEVTQSVGPDIPPRYTNPDGTTSAYQARLALHDWRADRITTDTLQAVFENWRSSR